jgi:hypothetical protein
MRGIISAHPALDADPGERYLPATQLCVQVVE